MGQRATLPKSDNYRQPSDSVEKNSEDNDKPKEPEREEEREERFGIDEVEEPFDE